MELNRGPLPSLLDRFLHLIEGVSAGDRLLLRLAFFATIGIGIWVLLTINNHFSALTPIRGGIITEGIVGTPRFINPALALTRADQDVTALVYDGLMKITPEGTLTPNIAESVTVSEDGLTYNVVLRKDVQFHDGTPLTARDVAYTIQLIQDPELKSPLRGNWTDVTVEEINEYELNIILDEAYAPFIENFTLGIMPAHAWSSLPIEQLPFSQLNTEPIGSGPFKIVSSKRDTSGLITHYTLEAVHTPLVEPHIDALQIAFYSNETQLTDALAKHEITSTAYVPSDALANVLEDETYRLVEEPLPRVFGIFFNQNKSPALRDIAVRQALTVAIDRDKLIKSALYGHGVPITTPIASTNATLQSSDGTHTDSISTSVARAKDILQKAGWKQTDDGLWTKTVDEEPITLSITIRTSNAPLFEALAKEVATEWQAIGVDVTTEQFEQAGLVQSVIRPRDFQALLFGLDMNRSYDLYPFWHSSQQDDPGLNISQYANVTVDTLLAKARREQAEPARIDALTRASETIVTEAPAVFLFRPMLSYVVDADMMLPAMQNLGRPSDRFSSVADWYTKTETLWPIFRNEL